MTSVRFSISTFAPFTHRWSQIKQWIQTQAEQCRINTLLRHWIAGAGCNPCSSCLQSSHKVFVCLSVSAIPDLWRMCVFALCVSLQSMHQLLSNSYACHCKHWAVWCPPLAPSWKPGWIFWSRGANSCLSVSEFESKGLKNVIFLNFISVYLLYLTTFLLYVLCCMCWKRDSRSLWGSPGLIKVNKLIKKQRGVWVLS